MLSLLGGINPLIPVTGVALVVLFLLLVAVCVHYSGAGVHEPDIERNYRAVGRNRVRWVHPWPLRAGALGHLHYNHRNLQAGHHHHHLHQHHHLNRHHHAHRAHR
ncbi:histidine-rich carboxyl terminus protein 1 [Trichosurus vulpecula]|uniref:histidine-rich carboxyl terminus protein 1 n=1 Tax=Trichosurus vulpecula TaxID=9337 RepID=UPI00186B18D0|nr:histidine-rich carboxyl terminus protein 1 [Trichosurus vulpecula]